MPSSPATQGFVSSFSENAERLFGRAAEDAVGWPLSALFAPHLSDEMDRVVASVTGRRADPALRDRDRAARRAAHPGLALPGAGDGRPRRHRRLRRGRPRRHRAAPGPGHAGRDRCPPRGGRGPLPRRAAGSGTCGPGPCSGARSSTGSTASTPSTLPAPSSPIWTSSTRPTATPARAAMTSRCRHRDRWTWSTSVVHPDQKPHLIRVHANPTVGSDGKAVGLRGIGQDVTDQTGPSDEPARATRPARRQARPDRRGARVG